MAGTLVRPKRTLTTARRPSLSSAVGGRDRPALRLALYATHQVECQCAWPWLGSDKLAQLIILALHLHAFIAGFFMSSFPVSTRGESTHTRARSAVFMIRICVRDALYGAWSSGCAGKEYAGRLRKCLLRPEGPMISVSISCGASCGTSST